MADVDKNLLRSDEKFVVEAVSAFFGGEWRPGEDPPDAYLTVHGTEAALEISTLTQYVSDEGGGLKPRFSEDATALWVVRELKTALLAHIPDGRTVLVIMSSPIVKARQVRDRLTTIILEHIAKASHVEASANVLGNEIKIIVTAAGEPDPEKLRGVVSNQNSSPNILQNARISLENRISVKAAKCRALASQGPVWLALLNDYWLADDDTYKQAFAMFSVAHPFEKIVLVSGNRAVAQLFPTGTDSHP